MKKLEILLEDPSLRELIFKTFDEYVSEEGYVCVEMANGSGWTYFNTKTGELLEERFKHTYDVKDGFGVVKLEDGKCTYFNAKTGKLLEERFKRAYNVRDGYGVVELENGKCTYFNAKTGKLLEERFNDVFDVQDGYGIVELEDGKWTYFNAKTGKLLEERFNKGFDMQDGYGTVELEDGKWTYFNAKTGKLLEERFNHTYGVYDGYGVVELADGKETYFNAKTGFVFAYSTSSQLVSKEPINWRGVLIQSPVDFDNLPSEFFEEGNEEKLNECLDWMAEGLSNAIPKNATSANLKLYKKYVDEIKVIVSKKIDREKGNTQQSKQENVENVRKGISKSISSIKDMGRDK